jgi:hypothetical protein
MAKRSTPKQRTSIPSCKTDDLSAERLTDMG